MMNAKYITTNAITGQRGVNLIERVVFEMGFQWYPTGGTEAGVDGIIEIRETDTGQATNCIVQVQSKATVAQFEGETPQALVFRFKPRDIQYWLGGNTPVVVVVSRPGTGEAYWLSVKEYFNTEERRRTGKAEFSKSSDRFDKGAAEKIRALALPRAAGLYLGVPLREELLYTNLIAIEPPLKLYVAPSSLAGRREVFQALTPQPNQQKPSGWYLHGNMLYSFHDLREATWKGTCEQGAAETLELVDFGDPGDDRVLKALMNNTLRELCEHRGLVWNKDQGCYFFPPDPKAVVRRERYESRSKKSITRTVVHAVMKKDKSGSVAFCRHMAFEINALLQGDSWFAELVPTHVFTTDGTQRDRFYEDKLKKLRQFEQNASILGQVIFLRDYLRGPADMFSPPFPYMKVGDLARFSVQFGVDDSSWGRNEEDGIVAPPIDDEDKQMLLELG